MTALMDHQALFHVMPIPRLIMQVEKDDRIVVVDVNARALDYFDCTRDQLVGRTVSDIMDSENARHFQQSFEVCLKHRMPVTIQMMPSFPGQVRMHGFWINPVMDDDGRVVFLDITGQPDAASESILQRERDDAISLLTSIFDASEVGIVVTDHNRRIVRVNESFVRHYGWSRDQIIGQDVIILVTVDEIDRMKKNHEEFINGGTRTTGEMKILRHDGTIADALFTTAMLELSQRRRFLVTTIMDITVRKQMEMSLRYAKDQADTANHAKSTFLANMSHELRTPLNAIIGFSELMMKETFGPIGQPKYQEYLGDIHFSARHLLEIINEVLDMSKIEAGRVELEVEEVDVPGVIESVIRIMTSRAFSSDITLKTKIQEGMPKLLADARLLRQILINLISNAVKFSAKGGLINIQTRQLKDGDIELMVQDFGIGIPKDKIREAMEPFGQITDNAHAAQTHQGTGLGLPLARAMTELHGGTLRVVSDTNQGTTVYVTLPMRRRKSV
jgi:two-component system, cell cycle sensor histidine kinase PleC